MRDVVRLEGEAGYAHKSSKAWMAGAEIEQLRGSSGRILRVTHGGYAWA